MKVFRPTVFDVWPFLKGTEVTSNFPMDQRLRQYGRDGSHPLSLAQFS